MSDVIPVQAEAGGDIEVNRFQRDTGHVDERQALNRVAVNIPVRKLSSSRPRAGDRRAGERAVLQKPRIRQEDRDLWPFTRTQMIPSETHDGRSRYVNSGTWIDNNNDLETMTFVVITAHGARGTPGFITTLTRAP
jgi:hypothetical protein